MFEKNSWCLASKSRWRHSFFWWRHSPHQLKKSRRCFSSSPNTMLLHQRIKFILWPKIISFAPWRWRPTCNMTWPVTWEYSKISFAFSLTTSIKFWTKKHSGFKVYNYYAEADSDLPWVRIGIQICSTFGALSKEPLDFDALNFFLLVLGASCAIAIVSGSKPNNCWNSRNMWQIYLL